METFEVYVKDNEVRCKKTHEVVKPRYKEEYLICMRKDQASDYRIGEVSCSERWLTAQRDGDNIKLTVDTDKRGVAKFSIDVVSVSDKLWRPEPLDPIIVND